MLTDKAAAHLEAHRKHSKRMAIECLNYWADREGADWRSDALRRAIDHLRDVAAINAILPPPLADDT